MVTVPYCQNLGSYHRRSILQNYHAFMEAVFSEYFFSAWGLTVTGLLTLVFGAKSYDVFAKLWLAHTGKYKAEGKITYSEFMQQPVWTGRLLGNDLNEGLITYSYHVDGRLFTGKIPPEGLNQEIVEERYFTGAKIDVYYSPVLPAYSFTGEAPKKFMLAKKALFYWYVLPVGILSIISIFTWSLMDIAARS